MVTSSTIPSRKKASEEFAPATRMRGRDVTRDTRKRGLDGGRTGDHWSRRALLKRVEHVQHPRIGLHLQVGAHERCVEFELLERGGAVARTLQRFRKANRGQ